MDSRFGVVYDASRVEVEISSTLSFENSAGAYDAGKTKKERRVINVDLYVVSCICSMLITLVVLTPESPCSLSGF